MGRRTFAVTALLIVTLGVVTLGAFPVWAGEPIDWHYMFYKEQRSLTLDTNRIAVLDPTPEVQSVDGSLQQIRRAQAVLKGGGPLAGNMGSGWELLDISGTPSGGSEDGVVSLITEVAENPMTDEYASPVFVAGSTTMIVLPQIQVQFQEDVPLATVQQLLTNAGAGAIIEADWVVPNTFVVEGGSRSGIDVLNTANTLAALEEVLWADVNWRFTGENFRSTMVEYPPPSSAPTPWFEPSIMAGEVGSVCSPMEENPPSDPLFQASWGLEQFNDIDVDATGAWAICEGSPSIVVAVLDDGVERFHPDLAGSVMAGMDFTGDCNPDLPCQGEPQEACDDHGTAVTGVILAGANSDDPKMSGIGGVGIAPGVMVLPIRVGHYWGGSCVSQLDQFDLAVGLAYAADEGADVSNLSWNFGLLPTSTLGFIYEATRDAGMIHFVSAGNDNEPDVASPGMLPAVHAVSGIDFLGTLFFVDDGYASNYGPEIEFTGPGRSVVTTDLVGDAGMEDSSGPYGGDYVSVTGTSYATPFVSGLAALVLSVNPELEPDEVLLMLTGSVVDLGSPGRDVFFGFGLPKGTLALNMARDYIFASSFETGDLSRWSNVSGGGVNDM